MSEAQTPARGGLLVALVTIGMLVLLVAFSVRSVRPESSEAPAPAESPAQGATDDIELTEAQRAHVVAVPVETRDLTRDLAAVGTLEIDENKLTPVVAPWPGRVSRILVSRGDRVTAGQTMIVIESPDLVSAHADLAQARADQVRAEIDEEFAAKAHKRNVELRASGTVAIKDLEQSANDLAKAQGETRRAHKALEALEHRIALFGKTPEEIERLGLNVDRRIEIKAPLDGIVVDRKVGLGQYVRPDSGDALLSIGSLDPIVLNCEVFEADLARIAVGTPLRVRLLAFPDRVLESRVAVIDQRVDASTRVVRVKCPLDNRLAQYRPGMFAHVEFRSRVSGALAVPLASIIVKDGKTYAFVATGPGRYRARTVTVGWEDGTHATVTSGLAPGDRVVVSGAILLAELIRGAP